MKELEQIKKQALLVKEFSSNTKSQVIASDLQAVSNTIKKQLTAKKTVTVIVVESYRNLSIHQF